MDDWPSVSTLAALETGLVQPKRDFRFRDLQRGNPFGSTSASNCARLPLCVCVRVCVAGNKAPLR